MMMLDSTQRTRNVRPHWSVIVILQRGAQVCVGQRCVEGERDAEGRREGVQKELRKEDGPGSQAPRRRSGLLMSRVRGFELRWS